MSLLLLSLVASAAPSPTPPGAESVIPWFQGPFSNAIGRAHAQEKMVLVYCWAGGSEQCVRLFGETMSTTGVTDALAGFVCYSANLQDSKGRAVAERFGVQTIPVMVFLGPDGRGEDAIFGFITEGSLINELARIQSGQGTVSHRRRVAEAAEKNTEDQFAKRKLLSDKLLDVGAVEESREVLASIARDDPEGETLTGAQVHLQQRIDEITAKGGFDDPASWDSAPLYKYVQRLSVPVARFVGWMRIANLEFAAGERNEACRAWKRAWKDIPDDQILDWSPQVAGAFVQMNDSEELSSTNRRFALEIMEASMKRAEATADADGDGGVFLPDRLATYSRVLWMNGKEAEAIDAAERGVALSEGTDAEEEYRRLLDGLVAQR